MSSDPMNCGVYTITAPSGNQYVGSSCNIASRWRRHRKEMKDGTHNNPILLNAYRKYGNALRFDIFIVCGKADLVTYEQIAIDDLKPRYNISPTAGSVLGIRYPKEVYASRAAAAKLRIVSAETRRLISLATTGLKQTQASCDKKGASLRKTMATPEVKARMIAAAHRRAENIETRAKISNALKGRKKPPRTAEHIEKIAASKRGTKASPETLAKMRAAHKGWKPSAETLERHRIAMQSPEVRAKLRAAAKGKTISAETRAKISAAQRGQTRAPLSKEHRAKISAGNKGKRVSEETRAKLRAARIALMANPEASKALRKKISAANSGKHHSAETRAKLSALNRGKHHTAEACEKIRAAGIGRRHSEESIAKMCVVQRLRRARMASSTACQSAASGSESATETLGPHLPSGTSAT
jgi:group I intron endonuclease